MKIFSAVLHEMGLPHPYAQSQPLRIENLDLGDPGDGEVLVRIRAAGLCHSDLSVINGTRPRPVPMALGHEAAGEVVACGDSVSDLVAGDRVVLVFVPSCGHCRQCAAGRPALCEPAAAANAAGTLVSGARRLSLNGSPINHHLGISGFADYAVVSRRSIIKIEPDLPFEIAALFGCAVITGVGSVVNTSKLRPGSTVAVVGLGGVGLNALIGAHMSGAREIIAIDLREDKLRLAEHLGATHAINANSGDCVTLVKEITDGGVDYAFEMAGSVPALELAVNITGRGGETITAGLPHPDKRLSIAPTAMVAEERSLRGSYLGSCVPVRDIPNLVQLYRSGQLPVDKLLSETIELRDINEGFDRLAAGDTIRSVVIL